MTDHGVSPTSFHGASGEIPPPFGQFHIAMAAVFHIAMALVSRVSLKGASSCAWVAYFRQRPKRHHWQKMVCSLVEESRGIVILTVFQAVFAELRRRRPRLMGLRLTPNGPAGYHPTLVTVGL